MVNKDKILDVLFVDDDELLSVPVSIMTDADCVCKCDDKEVAIIKTGVQTEIPVSIGKHTLTFISNETASITKYITIDTRELAGVLSIKWLNYCSRNIKNGASSEDPTNSKKLLKGKETNGINNKPKIVDSTRQSISGQVFLDLGLSSGLLWGATNLGSSTFAHHGNKYAFAEIDTKDSFPIFNMNGYKWVKRHLNVYNEVSKYNKKDRLAQLVADDDVVTVHLGQPCRIPTSSEWEELIDSCSWEYLNHSNGNACMYSAVGTGPNGMQIHFDISGYMIGGKIKYPYLGKYWSSTPSFDNNSLYAKCCVFDAKRSIIPTIIEEVRMYGLSIRPVCPNNKD